MTKEIPVIMSFRGRPITEPERMFLRKLIEWSGAATPQEIGPQRTQQDNSVRQACKRKGWVEFDRCYWRITEAGRDAYSAATLKIMDYPGDRPAHLHDGRQSTYSVTSKDNP